MANSSAQPDPARRAWCASALLHGVVLAALAAFMPALVRIVERHPGEPLQAVLIPETREPHMLPRVQADSLEMPEQLQLVPPVPEEAPEVEFEAEAAEAQETEPAEASPAAPTASAIVLDARAWRPRVQAPAPQPVPVRAPQPVQPALPQPSRWKVPTPPQPTAADPGNGGPSREAALDRPLRPVYPERLRREGVTGDVLLEVQVNPKGRTETVRVLSDRADPLFIREAVRAAESARFLPALEQGQPIAALVRILVAFRIE